jgi:hypothetical protein
LAPQSIPVPSGQAHPIDAFVAQKLGQNGWELAPNAPPAPLLRRVFFDLIGLPPPAALGAGSAAVSLPENLLRTADSFRSTGSDSDYSALVDALLESPHHGERWARHWLDSIHFADTHGFEHDILRQNAWRYRDYVIESVNRDTPWAQFIREQLAADVLFPDEPQRMAALGFLGAGPYDQSAAATAPKSFEYLDRDDLVTQTMGAFVSTTANCTPSRRRITLRFRLFLPELAKGIFRMMPTPR